MPVLPPPISRSARRPKPTDRLLLASLSGVALAQAVLVAWTGSGVVRVLAVLLALAGLNARLRALWVLAALVVINFGFHLSRFGGDVPLRAAHVTILVLYGTVVLAAFAGFFASIPVKWPLTLASIPALLLIGAELFLPRVLPPAVLGRAVTWFDATSHVRIEDPAPEPYAVLRSVYPDNPRGYFLPSSGAADGGAAGPGVDYALNAFGCRTRDFPVPNPRDRARLLVLGGAGAFGQGVHDGDTLATRLEQSLSNSRGTARPVDVINCGIPGSSTADQRAFYERLAFRYEPDVVLLLVSDRDNLSRADERRDGYVSETDWLQRLSITVRLVSWSRHEGRRPSDFGDVADGVAGLEGSVRSRGSRLVVAAFRATDLDARWQALIESVSTRLKASGTPFEDLGPALLGAHKPSDLRVAAVDANPNEIAHREAGLALERILTNSSLLD